MGLYPDSPSRRMAWDVDGTVAFKQLNINSGVITELSAGNRASLNDELSSNVFGMTDGVVTDRVGQIFPELREFDGFFYAFLTFGSANRVQTSVDTTNGIDGVWVTQATNVASHNGTTYVIFRDEITSQAVPGVKGVRIEIDQSGTSFGEHMQTVHFYGIISPGETPDRILFLDTANADAVFTKPINWNEIPRGQTQTRSFKIKNNSSGLTINTIQVTAEDLYLNAGDWYTFGDDNVNFQATFAVGNLGPGATKLLYLKQIIPDAETLGLQAGRIKVAHDSLT